MDCAKNLEPQKSDFKSEMYEDPQATECTASVAAAHNVVPTLQLDNLDKSSPAKKIKMSMAQMMDKIIEQKLLEREKTEKPAKPEMVAPQPGTSGAEKTQHNKRRRKKRNKLTEAEPTKVQEEAGKEQTTDKPITLTLTLNELELKDLFKRFSKP
ncbi:uncharacterized protein LOC131952625 [Physella acuta]|uniref:uncharacterized protein LOC131952625 n=1 Tax=Physella acuta TaxID=109671 RepID=UPI0027DC1DB7|nr:uncharacterized protein LOC131952625 [Physella acuta]